ncbi:MAG TPA: hypothetical protein VGP72_32005 [Planctomycetota bacterium]|jgi:hypothetical protein
MNAVTASPQSSVGAPDIYGAALIAEFKVVGSSQGPIRGRYYVPSITMTSGLSPGHAFAAMPSRAFPTDEEGPNVALNAGGPAGQTPLKTRVNIKFLDYYGTSLLKMVGTLVRYAHNLGDDSLVGEIYDDRWLLSKVTIIGRMVYDPRSGRQYWDITQPTIFNFNGYQDCLDTPYGVRFAPSHRFGWRDQYASFRNAPNMSFDRDTDEPAPGYARRKARTWRCTDAASYIRDYCYALSASMRPAPSRDVGNTTLADGIVWNEVGANLPGFDRPLHHASIHNVPVGFALQNVARHAGPYNIYTAPVEDYKSELRFVTMDPKDQSSNLVLMTATYAGAVLGQVLNSADVIHSGTIGASIINQFDDTAIIGDAPAAERWMSTNSKEIRSTNKKDELDWRRSDSENMLEFAWDRPNDGGGAQLGQGGTYVPPDPNGTDEQAFRYYVWKHPAFPNTKQAFLEACVIWPKVFASYRTKTSANLWATTKLANMRQSARHARFKPFQLTGGNDSNTGDNPGNWQHKEIPVEYRLDWYTIWSNIASAEADLVAAKEYAKETADAAKADPTPENKAAAAVAAATVNRLLNMETYTWAAAQWYANLTLNVSNEVIMADALRLQEQSWYANKPYKWVTDDNGNGHYEVDVDTAIAITGDSEAQPSNNYYGPFLAPRQIRLNAAVEADWPLVGRNKEDPNGAAPLINPGAPKFTYLQAAQPGDYVEYLRPEGSRPNGAAQIPKNFAIFSPNAATGQELFSDDKPQARFGGLSRLQSHAQAKQRHVNRVGYSGNVIIARYCAAMEPGLAVEIRSVNGIQTTAVVDSVTLDSMDIQKTIVGFGEPDDAVIYDHPAGGISTSGGVSMSVPVSSTTEQPKTPKQPDSPSTGQEQPTQPTSGPTSPQYPTTSGSDEGNRGGTGQSGQAGQAGAEEKTAAEKAGYSKTGKADRAAYERSLNKPTPEQLGYSKTGKADQAAYEKSLNKKTPEQLGYSKTGKADFQVGKSTRALEAMKNPEAAKQEATKKPAQKDEFAGNAAASWMNYANRGGDKGRPTYADNAGRKYTGTIKTGDQLKAEDGRLRGLHYGQGQAGRVTPFKTTEEADPNNPGKTHLVNRWGETDRANRTVSGNQSPNDKPQQPQSKPSSMTEEQMNARMAATDRKSQRGKGIFSGDNLDSRDKDRLNKFKR